MTQVLSDGEHEYVYGLDLLSQSDGIYEDYPLRDALGSVRQVTDPSSGILGSRNYEPYGSILSASGEDPTTYGYAGEWTDPSGMQYLRARYYDPSVGRFVSRDRWGGDPTLPMSNNAWLYGYSNPIKYSDPTGMFPEYCHKMSSRIQFEDCVRKEYGLNRPREYNLVEYNDANDIQGCHYEVSFRHPVSYDAEGYFEGLGSVWFGRLADQQEVVYDFATMTRANFDIQGGQISDSLLGAGGFAYAGIIGSPYFTNTGFSVQHTIEQDYEGPSFYETSGISTETAIPLIPSPGIFGYSFLGLNLNPLRGEGYGIGLNFASDPLPFIDYGMGISAAIFIDETQKTYLYKGGDGIRIRVDEGLLRSNIWSGEMSPWAEFGILNSYVNPLIIARAIGQSKVHEWVTVFEDLHNEN